MPVLVCVRRGAASRLSAEGTAVKGGAWVMMAMHHCVCVCLFIRHSPSSVCRRVCAFASLGSDSLSEKLSNCG